MQNIRHIATTAGDDQDIKPGTAQKQVTVCPEQYALQSIELFGLLFCGNKDNNNSQERIIPTTFDKSGLMFAKATVGLSINTMFIQQGH
jgi:hypothetical protein